MHRTRILTRLCIALAVVIAFVVWYAPAEAAPPSQNNTSQVYALPGQLRIATNQPFATYLVVNNGDLYGLTGETPQVESQIVSYRDSGTNTEVKVWGTLYPEGLTSNSTEIVVKSIQPADDTDIQPAATPVPDITTPQAIIRFESVNVRSGPGLEYAVIGARSFGESCDIVGRDAASAWWQIRCADGLIGWISADVVRVAGSVAGVPVVAAPPPPPVAPPPTPVPPSTGAWEVNYFANRNLSGQPVMTQRVDNIQFNWGEGSPGPAVPVDNFSARFQRIMNFDTGTYEFRATYDDGIRIYVDGQPILNDWQEGSARSSSAQMLLSGQHDIRVEYFEATGTAAIVVAIGLVRATVDWQATYFNNTDLSGAAVLVRGEPRGQQAPLDYNWGDGSPAPGVVNNDFFSARWVGSFYFEAGDYTFQVNVDDGARLFIDGIRVIDAWSDGYQEVSNVFYGVGAGNHQITVEYYERTGGAAIRAWWWRSASGGGSSQPSQPDYGRSRDE
ncbi:MAG: PA14 domain-containing protein [Caldilineaceae bacterium]